MEARHSDETVRWDSAIVLDHDLFNEILAAPVPIDMYVLRELRRSSVGLDLYLWLTYRLFRLDRPLRLSWRQVCSAVRAWPGAGARWPPSRRARARRTSPGVEAVDVRHAPVQYGRRGRARDDCPRVAGAAWLTSAWLRTMVGGVLATSAMSIVLVMAARSGKLGCRV